MSKKIVENLLRIKQSNGILYSLKYKNKYSNWERDIYHRGDIIYNDKYDCNFLMLVSTNSNNIPKYVVYPRDYILHEKNFKLMIKILKGIKRYRLMKEILNIHLALKDKTDENLAQIVIDTIYR
jgi:hypothetical protein